MSNLFYWYKFQRLYFSLIPCRNGSKIIKIVRMKYFYQKCSLKNSKMGLFKADENYSRFLTILCIFFLFTKTGWTGQVLVVKIATYNFYLLITFIIKIEILNVLNFFSNHTTLTCMMTIFSLIHWCSELARSRNCCRRFWASTSNSGWPGGGSGNTS